MSAGLPVVATTMASEGTSLNGWRKRPLWPMPQRVHIRASPASTKTNCLDTLKPERNRIRREGLGDRKSTLKISRDSGPTRVRFTARQPPPAPSFVVSDISAEAPAAERVLNPVFVASTRSEFERALQNEAFTPRGILENRLEESAVDDIVSFDGFCVPCNARVALQIVMGPTTSAVRASEPELEGDTDMSGMRNEQPSATRCDAT